MPLKKGKKERKNIFKNFKMAYCTVGKLQYKDFIVFACQSEIRVIFILLYTKQPVDILVFGTVTINGNFTPPFVFSHGPRFGSLHQVPTSSASLIERVAAEDSMSDKQVTAPCHISRRTQSWL